MALILFFFDFLRSIFSHRLGTGEKKLLKAKKVGVVKLVFSFSAILCFF